LVVGLQRDGIVTLNQRIKDLVQKERFLAGQALLEIVALEHPSDAQFRRDLDQFAGVNLTHPFAVEADFGLCRIENQGDLPLIGRGVLADLLRREWLARLRAAGGIADHGGEIAHQKNHRVAALLKIAQLFQRDRMTEMEVRRRRIHPELMRSGRPSASLAVSSAAEITSAVWRLSSAVCSLAASASTPTPQNCCGGVRLAEAGCAENRDRRRARGRQPSDAR